MGEGFWSLNVDTLLFSVGVGILLSLGLYLTARRATAGVPGKWQNFVEFILGWIHDNVKQVFHYDNPLIAPLGITIFIWVWAMNFMDMLPVDLLPWIAQHIGIAIRAETPSRYT